MRRLFFILMTVIAVSLALAEPPTGPRLRLEKKVVDLGDVRRGTFATDTIRFYNAGEDTLVINDVSSSCGCTVAQYSHSPLAPNESGSVIVKFDAGNRALGKFRKTLRIRSNALNFRELVFIDGNIIDEE